MPAIPSRWVGWWARRPLGQDRRVRRRQLSDVSANAMGVLAHARAGADRRCRAATARWRAARALRADIDAVSFQPMGRADTMTWAQSLDANYTDGIVVLHRGRIVYERYFGVLTAERQHLVFSVTKSFVADVGGDPDCRGRARRKATVAHYVPELQASGVGDATIRQLLDMTTGIEFVGGLRRSEAPTSRCCARRGILPAPERTIAALRHFTISEERLARGAHGERFAYKTPNTDVLGWVLRRVSGKPVSALLHERIWQRSAPSRTRISPWIRAAPSSPVAG